MRKRLARRSAGAILVEFIITAPVFLAFAAAVIELGSVMWEIQLVHDALRHGARRASLDAQNYLGDYWRTTACSDLSDKAVEESNAYIQSIGFNTNRWHVAAGDAQVKIVEATVNEPSQIGGSAAVPVFILSVKATMNKSETCVFCFAEYMRALFPKVYASATMNVPRPAPGYPFPAGCAVDGTTQTISVNRQVAE